MTSHLNYLIAQQRHIELARYAEQARLANDARPAGSASSPRWNLGRLLATRRLKAARVAAAARQRNPGTAARVPEMRHMTVRGTVCASSAAAAESLVVANGTRISLRQVGTLTTAPDWPPCSPACTPESRYQRPDR